MQIEPANIDQVRRASDGRMVEISANVGNVAEDLRRMDPHLKVRFAEAGNPPFFAVLHESDDGRTTQLVTTVRAHQNSSGVWEGLDQRVVRHLEKIDGQKGYDYASELEKQNREASKRRHERFSEQIDGARAAHALRKDLDVKDRVFIPRDIA